MATDTSTRERLPTQGALLSESMTLMAAALLAAVLIALATVLFLTRHLPEQTGDTLTFPVSDMRFAFGSGTSGEDLMQVNQFADGYALLSSGPVNIQADQVRALGYTWLPPRIDQEAAFFWRRADDPGNVSRTDITIPGTQLIDLQTEPGWSGEILEIGYLVAGESAKPVAIGTTVLHPDSLSIRLQLTWKAWSSLEDWSQQSINFLYGGDYHQIVSLPLLVAAWLCVTLLIIGLFRLLGANSGSRQMLLIAGGFFLLAWMLLDIRWTVNSIRQARLTLDTRWHADEHQRLGTALDGEIYQYVQRLKTSVLGEQNARILIVGDDDAIDYFLLRAKYHLLPHSAHVARRFDKSLTPQSLDFVIYFGQPESIVNVPGWNTAWHASLVKVDSGEWGDVFRVRIR